MLYCQNTDIYQLLATYKNCRKSLKKQFRIKFAQNCFFEECLLFLQSTTVQKCFLEMFVIYVICYYIRICF